MIRLDDIAFGDEEVDATLKAWREGIECANNWYVDGACEYDDGSTGHMLNVHGYRGTITAVVATGGITARVNATTLGQGNVVLWYRVAGTPNLKQGPTVKVYSTFAVAVPAGTFVEVAPEGDAYKLLSADCPA